MTQKRPLLFYMLILVFVLAAATSFLGLIQVQKTWAWLDVFNSQPSPLYLIFKNAFLTIAWIAAAVILWNRLHWAPFFAGILTLLTAIWFWLDRAILVQNPLAFERYWLQIIITVVLDLLVLLSLYLLVPYMNDRTQPVRSNMPGSVLEAENEKTTP